MSTFIQVIEWSTSRIDEVRALGEARRAEMQARAGGPVRLTIAGERTRPGKYVSIVEFSSYEDAMRNSQDPATDSFAREMAALCDGPPTFHDLDVLETHVFAVGQPTAATT